MPLIGYVIGDSLNTFISSYSSYISFTILLLLGLNMVKNALQNSEEDEEKSSNPLAFMGMVMAAIATSIDALAVGVIYSYNFDISIFIGITIIGVTTFIISIVGVKLGYLFNNSFRQKAEVIAGFVLIALGVRFLIN